MMIDLELAGCRPEPLGSYLKALAVLRLVGEQKDPGAKGYWRDDTFHLVSALDTAALVDFFAREYQPTPIVGPWGARSGFFPGSSESSAREALEAIEKSTLPRLASFRATIGGVRACLAARGVSEKAKDDDKIEVLAALRNALPDASLRWLDAAYVLGSSVGERGFPIILGTGGNEGSQGFSSTFMRALIDLGLVSDRPDRDAIRVALRGGTIQGAAEASTGQFAPGRTPGVNQAAGFSGGQSASAFDMVLAFEGAATWVSGAAKRQSSSWPTKLSSPFTVRSRAVGFNSAGRDEGKARGEIWLPIWSRPASAPELEALIAEGRAQWRGRNATTAIDIAKAAGALGVDRGIEGFERQTVLDRNGKNYFAVGAGRFEVYRRSLADLLRELDPALDRVDSRLRVLGDRAPVRLVAVRRNIDDALLSALRTPDGRRLLALLRAIGRMEALLSTMDGGRKVLKTPLGGLSTGWLVASEDCLELRIAAALSSIQGEDAVGPLRANLIPLDPRRPYSFGSGSGQVAWAGNTLAARLGAVLRRRTLDYERLGCRQLPLRSRIYADGADVGTFLDGRTDDVLLEDLLFGLTWVDWRRDAQLGQVRARWARPVEPAAIPPAYALLKSVLDPRHEWREPRIVPLLLAGKVDQAVQAATARLRVARQQPVSFAPTRRSVRPLPNPSIDAVRLAASLLIPVRDPDLLLRLATHRGPHERMEA